ncbi:DUF3068 domain-containing protein [Umezawaea beigongshangensis]|uniref:DUF3068 domain-containing protein n=1 Tax=Umezawaea beigongshangensis TaxID=2780383 RepID=UPI0018F1D87B|nr:DUF3068 domain-containing protein [Umezawaea beigongshangensis]
MRRVVGLVLIGVGVFALALGLLLRFYVYPSLAVVPLEQKVESVARGTATVFYTGDMTLRRNVELTATRKVESNLTRPDVVKDGDVMVWDQGLLVTDQRGTTISALEHRVCLDRRTNAAVERCSESYVTESEAGPTQADRDVEQRGLHYKFPFGTERRDYEYFDTTLRTATTARFEAEDVVNGLEVYRFVQDVPTTKIREQEVPGDLVGSDEPSVRADRYYQNTRTMWVEPVSGIIVKGREQQKQTLRGPEGTEGTTVLDGTLTFTEETIVDSVARAEDSRGKLFLLHTAGPLALIPLGVVLALFGTFALITAARAGKRDRENSPPDHLAAGGR